MKVGSNSRIDPVYEFGNAVVVVEVEGKNPGERGHGEPERRRVN